MTTHAKEFSVAIRHFTPTNNILLQPLSGFLRHLKYDVVRVRNGYQTMGRDNAFLGARHQRLLGCELGRDDIGACDPQPKGSVATSTQGQGLDSNMHIDIVDGS